MSISHLIPEDIKSFARSVYDEMAPFPGRANMAMRLILTSALVIIISQAYRIPLLPLSLVIVFYTIQSNATLTRIVGALLFFANFVSVSIEILVLKYTYEYPLIRILCTSFLFFLSMYAMRVSKLGIIFFGAAVATIYLQSIGDFTDQAEYILHQIFWSLFALNYPIALALIINTLLFPDEPIEQLRNEVSRQLNDTDTILASLSGEPDKRQSEPLTAQQLQKKAVHLHKLATFSAIGDKGHYASKVYRETAISAISRIYQTVNLFRNTDGNIEKSVNSEKSLSIRQSTIARLREQIRILETTFSKNQHYKLTWTPTAEEQQILATEAHFNEIYKTLLYLSDFDIPQDATETKPKESLFVSDIRTNPNYSRYALKLTFCSALAYLFYNAVQWEGIHTMMLTCGIIAYPTLGATLSKGTLRIYGGILGSIAALLISIFVFPYINSITALLLTVMPIIAIGAWIATGSERIAYIGTQMVLTMSLAILNGFEPSHNLVEIRDRLIGILLGVTLVYFAFTYIWPESADSTFRQKMTALLRSLAQLIRPVSDETPKQEQIRYVQQHLDCWSQINQCEEMLVKVRTEKDYRQGGKKAYLADYAQTLIESSRDILIAQDTLRSQVNAATATDPDLMREIQSLRQQSADLCDIYANSVENQKAPSHDAQQNLFLANQRLKQFTPADPLTRTLLANARTLINCFASLPDWSSKQDNGNTITKPVIEVS